MSHTYANNDPRPSALSDGWHDAALRAQILNPLEAEQYKHISEYLFEFDLLNYDFTTFYR